MGEISSASSEQSAGVSQVGEAITQMDQATQQNAALVEESAAAAASLKTQAQQLVEAVRVFKLSAQDSATAPAAPRQRPTRANTPGKLPYQGVERRAETKAPAAAAAAPRAPTPATPSQPAATSGDDDWTSF
jgi:hypothetical protein